MKRKVTLTMEYIFEIEDEDIMEGETFDTFADIREADYDSVGRPLERMEDEGWKITSSKVE